MMPLPSSSPHRLPQRLKALLWGAAWQPVPRRLLGSLCLLLTMAGLLTAVMEAARLQTRIEATRGAVIQAELKANPTASRRTTPLSAVTPAQADAINHIVDHLNVPWALVLNDLESLTPASIAVLQVEPRVAANAFQWQVEGKSRQDVFAYLDKLRAAKTLKQVRLVKFETNTQDTNRPTRFLLEAQVGGDAPRAAMNTPAALAAGAAAPSGGRVAP